MCAGKEEIRPGSFGRTVVGTVVGAPLGACVCARRIRLIMWAYIVRLSLPRVRTSYAAKVLLKPCELSVPLWASLWGRCLEAVFARGAPVVCSVHRQIVFNAGVGPAAGDEEKLN